MVPYFTDHFGNPASRHHAFGWAARDAVERARHQVADLIACDPREVYFTSGATESNNLAIKGVVDAHASRPAHIVTAATEHRAVLDPCRRLEAQGARLTIVQPREDGIISVDVIERALTDDTVLVSVMAANNEIGVLQPVDEIAALTRERGLLFHTDAAQAIGRCRSRSATSVSTSPLSQGTRSTGRRVWGRYLFDDARVFRSPRCSMVVGMSVVFVRGPSTCRVSSVVAMQRSSVRRRWSTEAVRTASLRDRLRHGFEQRLGQIQINGSMECRLPNNLNIGFSGLEGESLFVGLDDVAVSSGAACTSANPEPSPYCGPLGCRDGLARASLRFGLGRWTTAEEIDYTVDKVSSLVMRLRQLSSVGRE